MIRLSRPGWASRLAPSATQSPGLTVNIRVRSRGLPKAAGSSSVASNSAPSSWTTSRARPIWKNPPMATVSPMRISRTASLADTTLPVEPDRAVGTMDLMLIGPRSLGNYSCAWQLAALPVDNDRLDDASRPIRPLELYENPERALEAGLLLFGGYQSHVSAYPAADRHRCREANPVDAVVDGGRHRVDLENVVQEHRAERQGQVTVRDRAAVRTLRGAPGLDVDPLMIMGGIGEDVHLMLGDRMPLARPDLLADHAEQVSRHVQLDGHRAPIRLARQAVPDRIGVHRDQIGHEFGVRAGDSLQPLKLAAARDLNQAAQGLLMCV